MLPNSPCRSDDPETCAAGYSDTKPLEELSIATLALQGGLDNNSMIASAM